MEDKTLDLEVGTVKISVKLNEEGVCVDVLKKMDGMIGFCREDQLLKSSSKTYDELGIEIKELPDE
jgi:hypothetical protein